MTISRRAPILALVFAACFDLPEPTHHGAHVVIAADPGYELCGGTVAHMDAFVAALSAAFSLAPPTADERFTFYLLDADEIHERHLCPVEATACASGGNSYNPYAPLNHEIVHNVAEALGDPLPLFSEGLAEAFEGLGDAAPEAGRRSFLPIRDLVGLITGVQLARAGGYSTAGAFTTHLVRRHGLDAYLRLYSAVGPLETARGVDELFREEFGVSLDDSVAAFELDMASCTRQGGDAKLLECAAPELEWSGRRLQHHRSIGCDQDDAVGPYSRDSAVVFYTVDVPADGDYVVTVLGDDPRGRVSLQPCSICGGEGVAVAVDEPQRSVALAAGRYSLRLHGPASIRTSVGVRIEPVDAPVHMP
ncbi:hypothetical protein OV203_18550 [Nannocystis sp. ILAH1]|uniref:hypothetical protein n=1 Tax=Nannocystis sp. ILAH1 TaxID=2996789 RepID=UPI00226EF525|nr:hypothetical protein [Nannocystis sp. ILAH1]MCY0989144.1 hypothetical protein [Nannocystis sp. ILAH1]